MKKISTQVKFSPNEIPEFDPKKILDKAGIDYDKVDSIDPDALVVSENLSEAWRGNMDANDWDTKGPAVDADLPDDTVAIFSDKITMSKSDIEGDGGEISGEVATGQGSIEDSTENVPGVSARNANMAPRRMARQRYIAKADNPRDYHQKKTRVYDVVNWWNFEEDVSRTEGNGPHMGEPKKANYKRIF